MSGRGDRIPNGSGRHRGLLRFVRVAQWVVLPSLLLSVLAFIGTSGAVAFRTGFTIENRTARPLTVTPIGTGIDAPGKGRLPTMCEGWPLPAVRDGKYVLGPGERVTVYYNSDDVVVSDLVIEADGHPARILAVDPSPRRSPGGPFVEPVFVVDSVDTLPAAPADVQAMTDGAGSRAGLVTALAAGIVLPWVVGGILVVIEWRLKRSVGSEPRSVGGR